MTDNPLTPPSIPEDIEAPIKCLEGQLEAMSILVARILQRLEQQDESTPESMLQELEEIQKTGIDMAGSGGQDDWRFRSFGVGFSHAIVRIRGALEDLPPRK